MDFSFKFTVDGSSVSALSLAFQGRLQEEIDKSTKTISAAYPKAMTAGVVDPGKKALRATVESTGFYRAGALAKTWRAYTYPGSAPSLEPAGVFKSRAGVIVEAFESGVTIHASGSKFLAVPEGPAKAIVHRLNQAVNRTREGRGGRFAKEDSTVARVATALGVELVPLIDRKLGRGVLVAAENGKITKGGRVAKRQGGRPTPLFALVRQATLKPHPMGREVLDGIRDGALNNFLSALVTILPPGNQ